MSYFESKMLYEFMPYYQPLRLYECLNVHVRVCIRPLYSTCFLLYCITWKGIMYRITQWKEERHEILTYCTTCIR